MMRTDRFKKNPTLALAKPGDPLVTGDGRVINADRLPSAPTPRDDSAIRKHITPSQFRPTRRISVKELPAPTNVMNGVGVIFMYTMLGLSDREIAELLQLAPERIEQLREHQAYSFLFESTLREYVNAESELIESRIAAYSHSALSRVHDLSEMSEDDAISLRASMDLLDRAGHSPKNSANRNSGMDSEALRIVIMDGNAPVNININTPSE